MLTAAERALVILAVQCEFELTVKMVPYRMPWFRDPEKQRAVERTARFYRKYYRCREEQRQSAIERRFRRTVSTSGDAAHG